MTNDLGKIHIYTGNGKGKTTSAFGLGLRAVGAGYKVYIIQFLKGQDYSELRSLAKIKGITLKRFGQKSFIIKTPKPEDIIQAKRGLAWAKKVVKSKKFNVVILDEIFLALFFKMLKVSEVVSFVKSKPSNVELILTGRYASPQLIKLADYVTEVKEIKHPYAKGLKARRGIEN